MVMFEPIDLVSIRGDGSIGRSGHCEQDTPDESVHGVASRIVRPAAYGVPGWNTIGLL